MVEEEPKKVESETLRVSDPARPEKHIHTEDVASKKSVVRFLDENVSRSKPPATNDKLSDAAVENSTGDSVDRDAVLEKVETEKRLALVKAWEDSEKTKAENKAYKKLSAIGAWENSKRASVEAELKLIEEKFEIKKAEYAEKMKNKIAELHKTSEEKKAAIEAKRGEDLLKVEEEAAKFQASGRLPRKLFGCLSC